jgi:nicotinic acid phosphoribosyltransferase
VEAVFHLSFRKPPFQSGFTVAAGLGPAIDFLRTLVLTGDDAAFLAGLTGNDGRPLFAPAFLDYLRHLDFTCSVDAIPEGTGVFAQEPLLRIQGPIYDIELGAPDEFTIVDPRDPTRRKHFPLEARFEDLLVPIFRGGELVYRPPPLAEIRERTREQLGLLQAGAKRLVNPHAYPVGLEARLNTLRTDLILRARGESSTAPEKATP